MLDGFTLGQNYTSDSPIHRLSAKTKLLMSAVLVLGVLVQGSPGCLALLGIYLMILFVIARVPASYFLRNIPVILLSVLLVCLSSALSQSGPEAFRIGPLAVSCEGVWRGMIAGYKVAFTFFSLSLLTLTTSPTAMSHAIASFLAPLDRLGISTEQIVLMATISLAYIPLLVEDTQRIVEAHSVRGGDFRSLRPLRRSRALFSVLVALIASSLRRAEDLAMAMEVRCYTGQKTRTRYLDTKPRQSDFWFLMTTGFLVLGAFCLSLVAPNWLI